MRATKTCALAVPGQCLRDLLNDQAGIWTSPFHIRSHDLVWLVPLAGAMATAVAYDRRTLEEYSHPLDAIQKSRDVSRFGSAYVVLGAAGAAYIFGSLAHKDSVQETGRLGAEAVIDGAIVAGVLKFATNRERPDQGNGHGDFWPHGTRDYPAGLSFPSMHATSSWALARVIAGEYPGRPLVKVLVYGWATAISASRATSRKHFPSDVLAGSALGYLIGGYVLHRHSDLYRDDTAYSISPYFDERHRSYGLTVSIRPGSLRLPLQSRFVRSRASGGGVDFQ